MWSEPIISFIRIARFLYNIIYMYMYMYVSLCLYAENTKLCCLLLWFQVHIRVYENAHFSNSAETHWTEFTGITRLLIPANRFTVFIHACTNMCKYVHNTYHTYIHMVHIQCTCTCTLYIHVHVYIYQCLFRFFFRGGEPI